MDQFNLMRFLEAQEEPMFGWVIEELTAGKKKGHWMWFIFPQAFGLGESHHSQFYGIKSLDEAKAYWEHPILGERIRKCLNLVLKCGSSVLEVFGKEVDVMKFQSCITLFLQIAPDDVLLIEALDRFFVGKLDQKTMSIIENSTGV